MTPDQVSAGFSRDAFVADQIELEPDLWPVWRLWCDVSGQWRRGLDGPEALDYAPLFMRMERMRLDDDTWERMFSDIRVIEHAALRAMRGEDSIDG